MVSMDEQESGKCLGPYGCCRYSCEDDRLGHSLLEQCKVMHQSFIMHTLSMAVTNSLCQTLIKGDGAHCEGFCVHFSVQESNSQSMYMPYDTTHVSCHTSRSTTEESNKAKPYICMQAQGRTGLYSNQLTSFQATWLGSCPVLNSYKVCSIVQVWMNVCRCRCVGVHCDQIKATMRTWI